MSPTIFAADEVLDLVIETVELPGEFAELQVEADIPAPKTFLFKIWIG